MAYFLLSATLVQATLAGPRVTGSVPLEWSDLVGSRCHWCWLKDGGVDMSLSKDILATCCARHSAWHQGYHGE